ncbi:hypothetical protein LEMLEM_LOCUS9608 [Lemmus lemmus]
MGPKDSTFIWLIRCHDADDTTTEPVWIPSTRTISTWTADMDPLDKMSSPCQQEVTLENDVPLSQKTLSSDFGISFRG